VAGEPERAGKQLLNTQPGCRLERTGWSRGTQCPCSKGELQGHLADLPCGGKPMTPIHWAQRECDKGSWRCLAVKGDPPTGRPAPSVDH
jgi:hypothetical protein